MSQTLKDVRDQLRGRTATAPDDRVIQVNTATLKALLDGLDAIDASYSTLLASIRALDGAE